MRLEQLERGTEEFEEENAATLEKIERFERRMQGSGERHKAIEGKNEEMRSELKAKLDWNEASEEYSMVPGT